jgi:hypothetical protein
LLFTTSFGVCTVSKAFASITQHARRMKASSSALGPLSVLCFRMSTCNRGQNKPLQACLPCLWVKQFGFSSGSYTLMKLNYVLSSKYLIVAHVVLFWTEKTAQCGASQFMFSKFRLAS